MAESDDVADEIATDPARTGTRLTSGESGSGVYYGLTDDEDEMDPGDAGVDPMIGVTIAHRYHIEKLAGKGGMASVYEAVHVALKKRVAVKILHRCTELDSEAIIRFQQEASGLALLQHPNIVSISDFGIAETGHPYYVMDLVEGKSLSDLIHESGGPQFKQLSRVFSEVCEALAYAHKKHIIHRDLKPGNIIIYEGEDGKWIPKLIDFGIAKFGELQNQDLTRSGAIFGSPLYMSPEQCTGEKLDRRTDIYSLGCTMYEAITGVPPFVGESVLQTLSMHAGSEPKAPHLVRNDVPVALEKIVLKCLEKKPGKRYQSALELKRDLNRPDLRSAGRRKRDRSLVTAFICAMFAIAGLYMYCLIYKMDYVDNVIDSVRNAALIRHWIGIVKTSPVVNKRTLAHLYGRLIDLETEDEDGALKDCLEAYDQVISRNRGDASAYSCSIASYIAYRRFRDSQSPAAASLAKMNMGEFSDMRMKEAAGYASVALHIFDEASPDQKALIERKPYLLECVNILVARSVAERPVDKKLLHEKVHRDIARATFYWTTMKDTVHPANLYECAHIFRDLGWRCASDPCDNFEDGFTCYGDAVGIYARLKDDASRKSAEEARDYVRQNMLAAAAGKRAKQIPAPAQTGVHDRATASKPQRSDKLNALNPAKMAEKTRYELDEASRRANDAFNSPHGPEYSRQYYELCRKYEPDSAEYFHAACFCAYCYRHARKLPQAFKVAREALSIKNRLGLGPSNDALVAIQSCIDACIAERNTAGATEYISQYFEMNENIYPNDAAKFARAEMDVGFIWSMHDFTKEALAWYLRAKASLEISRLTSTEDYQRTMDMLRLLRSKS